MKRNQLSRGQVLLILGGASVMISMAMGIRQSWGLFQPHMIRDLGITAADFSLAIAVQNIVWGATQPFVGMLADRHGARPVAIAGVLVYGAGVLLSLLAKSALVLVLGAGVCVGIAMSCTGSNIAMAVTARTVSPAARSVAMGAVSAIGSLGLTFASPLAQSLISSDGWQAAMVFFLALVAAMLPAAFFAGGSDRIEREAFLGAEQSVGEAVREAFGHSGYVVMALAFFVCGLQLVFLTTHLPTYLAICGMDPTVGSTALALVGLFNVGGSYLFGWLGGRYSKRVLLGGIYVLRSLFITAYFLTPPSPASTLVFAAAMGTLWLGVIPLLSGLVIHLFGLRFLATLAGIAFFSHQVGSFLGAWGGGVIYSALGSYDLAWKSAVAIGLIAGGFQMMMNVRPTARVAAERQAGARSVPQAAG
ncbi:MAG: MFS transporter [Betaproteobacteria bacterium]|nr:MFS transporter [Betaproteobacteria bacterium]MBI2959784.1 MFS transporter [Betaproteobacteria bacterium]